MGLQPIGHRILVKPDEQPDETASGLVLPQDRDHIPMSGTVVAIGPGGSAVRFRARQRAIRDCAEVIESVMRRWHAMAPLLLARDEIAGLLGSSDPEHEIAVGDRVAYPVEAGLLLTVDGESYIVLNEDDVAVLVREEEVAA
jgi:co-chaperonin GroES (HSP10)